MSEPTRDEIEEAIDSLAYCDDPECCDAECDGLRGVRAYLREAVELRERVEEGWRFYPPGTNGDETWGAFSSRGAHEALTLGDVLAAIREVTR